MKLIIFDLHGTIINYNNPPKLFPEVINCLNELKNDYNLVLVTEGQDSKSAKKVLQKLGIIKYFQMILGLKNTKLHKNDGSAFLMVAKKNKIKPRDIIIIGDTILTDIKGAKLVGAKSVLINREKDYCLEKLNNYEQADTKINSLEELGKVINKNFYKTTN